MITQRPLILITNDDGVTSKGLRTAAEVCEPLGELLIVAPYQQQSGAGRSMPPTSEGRIFRQTLRINDHSVTVYAIEGTPAQVVQHGLFELADRRVDLVVSGINYGENLGEGVSVSGTVGATMESASFKIPSIAISLETAPEHYLSLSDDVDFSGAAYFLWLFAKRTLDQGLPPKTDLLKIDVPNDATRETAWRWTRLSQTRYFVPVKPQRTRLADPGPMGYATNVDLEHLEPDSDVYAVRIDRVVAVTPLMLDMTAPIDLKSLPK